jgi:hypothetical protein
MKEREEKWDVILQPADAQALKLCEEKVGHDS